MTNKTSNWKLSSITGPGGVSLSSTTLTTPGTYTLKYKFSYDGETKETGNITITITESTVDPNPTDPGEEIETIE